MDYYLDQVAMIGICALLGMALNIVCGLTGLLHLGQAGFYAVGAYTAGLVSLHLWVPWLGAGNFFLSAASAMAMAALFALAIGLPCLRLKGDYLAIATLGFGEIIRLTLENLDFVGGATGLRLTPEARFITWWQVWLVLGLSWLLLVNLKHSATGRAMQAIREDEIAARAMGVNVPLHKSLAFVLCAVFAGLAGALFAHKTAYFAPKRFDLMLSLDLLLIVVLGGLGSFSGSVLAAIVLVKLRDLPVIKIPLGGERLLSFDAGQHRELIFAILLIPLVRFFPGGLLGRHETPAWWRRRQRARQPVAPAPEASP